MSGVGNFAELLKSYFPEKSEEQISHVVTAATASPRRFSHPFAMSQLLQQKWRLSAANAYAFAAELALQLAKDANVTVTGGSANAGETSPSPFAGTVINQYMDAMLARSLFQDSPHAESRDSKTLSGVGSMDMDQLMKLWLMSKMMDGDSNTNTQSQYMLSEIKNSIRERLGSVDERLKKLEGDAGKEKESGQIRYAILPGEDGQPKKYPVHTESDVLPYLTTLLMAGGSGSGGNESEDKYIGIINKLIESNKTQNGEGIDRVESFYNKVVEQQDKRVEDLKTVKGSHGDFGSVVDSINKLSELGLKVGGETSDDKAKMLENEMKLMEKKFDFWLKASDKQSRDDMWNTLLGRVGSGIDNLTKNYSEEIKNFAQQIPAHFGGASKSKSEGPAHSGKASKSKTEHK